VLTIGLVSTNSIDQVVVQQFYELLWASAAVFSDAIDVFEQYDDQQLSVTDVTTVALADRHDVDSILSFDDDFDGIYRRTEPAAV